MTTAVIKKAKGLIGRLTKESKADVEKGKQDWKQAVTESAEQNVHVEDSVIHKLGSILGIDPSEAVEKFRSEVAAVEAYRIMLIKIAKYDSEMKEFEAIHSWEEAQRELKDIQEEVMRRRTELHRYNHLQTIVGSSYAQLHKIVHKHGDYFPKLSLKTIREFASKQQEGSSS